MDHHGHTSITAMGMKIGKIINYKKKQKILQHLASSQTPKGCPVTPVIIMYCIFYCNMRANKIRFIFHSI